MCYIAKGMWCNQQCEQIEKLRVEHKSKEMHDKVKYITNKRRGRVGNSCTTSKEGEILLKKMLFRKDSVDTLENCLMMKEGRYQILSS